MINHPFKPSVMIKSITFYFIVICILAIIIFPVLWVICTSMKPRSIIFEPIWIFKPTVEYYQKIFNEGQFVNYLINSVVVCIGTVMLTQLFAIPAAYAISRFTFKRKNQISAYILSSRFAPPILVILPFYVMYARLGLTDTKIGLIFIYVVFNLSFVIWTLKPFFDDIPQEIDDAAKIDGCSEFDALLRIVLPLILPGLAVTSIFTFLFCWNEFFFAFILTEVSARTLPLSVVAYASRFYGSAWGELSAVSTVVMIPIIMFSFLIQGRLAKGLTMGAVK